MKKNPGWHQRVLLGLARTCHRNGDTSQREFETAVSTGRVIQTACVRALQELKKSMTLTDEVAWTLQSRVCRRTNEATDVLEVEDLTTLQSLEFFVLLALERL